MAKAATTGLGKWAELSAHMVKDYERQLTEMGYKTTVHKGYGIAMHTTEDLTEGYSMTDAGTKCAERVTQDEESMAQME